MWNSVIRQNKDVCAQYEAIVALSKIPSPATGAIIVAVMKDANFFYRLRMEAAFSLTKFDAPELDNFGLNHLLKYLKENFCTEEDQFIPKCNNFEDLQEYYMRNAIITAITMYRDDRGWTPYQCRQILVDLLRWNDNTNNPVHI
jgi:transcription initiation factor TFIID subunit 2